MSDSDKKLSLGGKSADEGTEMQEFTINNLDVKPRNDSILPQTSIVETEISEYENAKQNSEFDNVSKSNYESNYESDEEINADQPLLENKNTNVEEIELQDMSPNVSVEPPNLANLESIVNEAETNLLGDQPQNEEQKKVKANRLLTYLEESGGLRELLKPSKTKLLFACMAIFLIFSIILLPNCIYSIEYGNYGLARNKLTGVVNLKNVYESGVHIMLPWKEWILFDRTAHQIPINELRIFTTDKLQVKATFRIYYFLDKETLPVLYRMLGENYKNVIKAVCISELTNKGQEFSVDDYRTKRIVIKNFLKNKLYDRLWKDYKIKLHDIYLDRLQFTKEINRLNLLRMLNGIFNEKAVYEKQETIVVLETFYQIRRIKNDIQYVLKSAENTAKFNITKTEQTQIDSKLEMVHLNNFNKSLHELKFYDNPNDKDKSKKILSFCWLSGLINHKNIRILNQNEGSSLFANFGTSSRGLMDLIQI